MNKFSFFNNRTKETVFSFETNNENPNKVIFEVHDADSDSYYLLSFNDIENNTYNLDFINPKIKVTKWFDFRSNNNIKWFQENGTPIEDRALFLTKSPDDTDYFFLLTDHFTHGGLKLGNASFNFKKDFVCHFIADKERNNNNQRSTFALDGPIYDRKLHMQRRTGKVFVTLNEDATVTTRRQNNYTFITPNQNDYDFKLFTFIYRLDVLRMYYNGVEIPNVRDVENETNGWDMEIGSQRNSIRFNTNTTLDRADTRGKNNRVMHFSFDYVKPGYNLQLDINNLITKYGL